MIHFAGDENKCPRAVDVDNVLQYILSWGGASDNTQESQGVLFTLIDDPMLVDASRDTYTYTVDVKYASLLDRLISGTGYLPILVIIHDNESNITAPATIHYDTNRKLHLIFTVPSGIRHAIYDGSLCIVTTLKV